MENIAHSKAVARKVAMSARAKAKSRSKDLLAAEALKRVLRPHSGKTIAGYMPILTEVDPIPAMQMMHSSGPVCVPVIEGKGLPLRFQVWTPGGALKDGPFGARVPVSGDWVSPDVIIVPLVGFSADGGRLGYGGGFYDRTLETLRKAGPVVAYGYAFSAQMVTDLPQEPTDQKLDGIITEDGFSAFD